MTRAPKSLLTDLVASKSRPKVRKDATFLGFIPDFLIWSSKEAAPVTGHSFSCRCHHHFIQLTVSETVPGKRAGLLKRS